MVFMRFITANITLSVLAMLLFSCGNDRYRVLYINSYHAGYPPSDEVMDAMMNGLPADSFDVMIRFLDTKRQPSDDSIGVKIDSILKLIPDYKPDILAISDDNAMKYLVEPHAAGFKIPVIFCGINWSAGQYKFSPKQVTGMLEVLPLAYALETLKKMYPNSTSLSIVSENTLSEKNNTAILDTIYKNMGLTPAYYLVDSFPEWKDALTKASGKSDLIYIPTNGGIKGWDETEAREFAWTNLSKPIFTCDDFMMNYAVIGFTKIPAEQGEWMAETIKRIVKGEKVENIPITKNADSKIWINTRMADKISFRPENYITRKIYKY